MNKLYDKIYGCIAASRIASSMGAPREGRSREEIVREFGQINRLMPYNHYHAWDRPAGTTEDGIERQKLMCTAIIEKKGRVNAREVAKIWMRDINPDNFNVQMEPCDEVLYRLVKSGMPPEDVGRYTNWPGIVSFARSSHAVGLVNACNPEQAALDAMDVGRLYQPPTGRGLEFETKAPEIVRASSYIGLDWGAAYCAAIAEAVKETATIDSVVEAACAYVVEPVANEIRAAVALAGQCSDYNELVSRFNEKYNGRGHVYAFSMSHEIVSKGIAIFCFTKGNAKESILAGVNFGRDTDCTAATAAGLSGAFSGSTTIPNEWIDTVDEATKQTPYTVSQMSIAKTAQGLFEAVVNEMKKKLDETAAIQKLIG